MKIEENEKTRHRLVLAKDVDLSKAKKDCKLCNGTGIDGHRQATKEELAAGAPARIPSVCDCVINVGGVKRDYFVKMMESISKKLRDGTFSRHMAKEILKLPEPQRTITINKLRTEVKENPQSQSDQAMLATLQYIEREISAN